MGSPTDLRLAVKFRGFFQEKLAKFFQEGNFLRRLVHPLTAEFLVLSILLNFRLPRLVMHGSMNGS